MSLAQPPRSSRWSALLLRLSLVALGLAPLWASWLRGSRSATPLIALADRWFAFQCAQDPARAVRVFGHALPVCARCTGIYLGLAAGGLLALPRLGSVALRAWLLAASALMLLDVLSEARGFRPPLASLRLATGALFAYPVGVALVQWLTDRIRDRAKAESRNPSSAPSTSD